MDVTKKKKRPQGQQELPMMYDKGMPGPGHNGIKSADESSEWASDPFKTLGYGVNTGVEPFPPRGIKGAGSKGKSIDKLKGKMPPRGKQSGER